LQNKLLGIAQRLRLVYSTYLTWWAALIWSSAFRGFAWERRY